MADAMFLCYITVLKHVSLLTDVSRSVVPNNSHLKTASPDSNFTFQDHKYLGVSLK